MTKVEALLKELEYFNLDPCDEGAGSIVTSLQAAVPELILLKERHDKMREALRDLLEQIDCLDGIEYTKDLEPYKAEAVWNDVLNQAQTVLAEVSHELA